MINVAPWGSRLLEEIEFQVVGSLKNLFFSFLLKDVASLSKPKKTEATLSSCRKKLLNQFILPRSTAITMPPPTEQQSLPCHHPRTVATHCWPTQILHVKDQSSTTLSNNPTTTKGLQLRIQSSRPIQQPPPPRPAIPQVVFPSPYH